MGPRIGVVVVNWNRKADTLRCIASVLASDYDNREVVLVDNASTDGSVQAIREAYPSLPLLTNPTNAGFTGGNNAGIRCALDRGADHVFLLNNDAIVEQAALGVLAAAAEAHPRSGFLGAKVCALEDRRLVLSAGGMLQDGWKPHHTGMGERDGGQFDGIAEVDYVSGCALLASRRAVETVGALDEDFYLYYEDVEWCYRARQAGFQILVVPQARVFHPDTRFRDQDSPVVTYYAVRNSLLFVRKHRLGYPVLLRMWLNYARNLISWTARPRWRHKRRQRDALVRALRDVARSRWGPAPSF